MMTPYYDHAGVTDWINTIRVGDALAVLRQIPEECVNCVVTSPPYWNLRDYGVAGQIGLKVTPEEYVAKMVEVFREVRRVLRSDGSTWINLGDSYAGSGKGRDADGRHATDPRWKQSTNGGSIQGQIMTTKGIDGMKPKNLLGMPWRVAFALQADGWYLRSDIIWSKPNPMPESVTDRPTRSHEYLFLLTKSAKYYYDANAIREPSLPDRVCGKNSRVFVDRDPAHIKAGKLNGSHGTMGHDGNGMRMPWKWNNPSGRNKRSVWEISPEPTPEAHFATFPQKLVEPCILAGAPEGGIVLDPFMGSGTTALVALKARRRFIGIELNPAYAEIARQRIQPELAQGRII